MVSSGSFESACDLSRVSLIKMQGKIVYFPLMSKSSGKMAPKFLNIRITRMALKKPDAQVNKIRISEDGTKASVF